MTSTPSWDNNLIPIVYLPPGLLRVLKDEVESGIHGVDFRHGPRDRRQSIRKSFAGLVTESLRFYWLFTIKDRCKKCLFNKRTIKVGISCFLIFVLEPVQLARLTWRCPCLSVDPEATHEARWVEGAMSAQKGLQGSETERRELLGGTEEKNILPQ